MRNKIKTLLSDLLLANRKRWLFNNLYRWCDDCGGGLVIASSLEDAKEKLKKRYPDRNSFIIWLYTKDDYFDEDNPDVLDIYG